MSDSKLPKMPGGGLLAIDVGSSRVKLGWFPAQGDCDSRPKEGVLPIAAPKLPQPEATFAVSHRDADQSQWASELGDWLSQLPAEAAGCLLASVHPEAAAKVASFLVDRGFSAQRVLSQSNVPLAIEVEHPRQVGIDRLLNALAANRLRGAEQPAIVVDVGTASTVDLVSAEGAFLGGAILPGIGMSAAALHTGTATLPLLPAEIFENRPEAVGKTTQEAIAAGIYWGAVGAVRELVDRLSSACIAPPLVLLTGGDAKRILPDLHHETRPVRHVPNMVLSGIRLASEELS